MKRFFQIILLLFSIWLIAGGFAQADTIMVDDASDNFTCLCAPIPPGTCCTLRAAIGKADSGDIITFESYLAGATISLITGELAIDENLTIDGDLDDDGTPDITVSGNNSSRVFSLTDAPIVTLNGLKIVDGLTITPPSPADGAGINIGDGCLVAIANSEFSDNDSQHQGGAIHNGDGVLLIRDSKFLRNTSAGGSALYNNWGTVYVQDSRFEANAAQFHTGGAI